MARALSRVTSAGLACSDLPRVSLDHVSGCPAPKAEEGTRDSDVLGDFSLKLEEFVRKHCPPGLFAKVEIDVVNGEAKWMDITRRFKGRTKTSSER